MKRWLGLAWLPRYAGALAAVCLVAACASSADVKQDNSAVKAAKNMERRAAQSFALGEYDSAAAGFAASALVFETLALPGPAARARLSQARALAEAGQVVLAQEIVQNVLQSAANLSPDLAATAHGRAAALAMASDVPRAQAHLANAFAACAKACAQLSALTALRARAELFANNAASAAISASNALASAQNNFDRANALRLRAQANAAQNLHAQVIVDAQTALVLDQDLGLAQRVLVDLQLLQRAHTGVGDSAAAARYGVLAARASAAATTLSTVPP